MTAPAGVDDYLRTAMVRPDRREAYGGATSQFGDLYLPAAPPPRPVLAVLHGGCWRPEYGLSPLGGFCRALADALGAAVWSLEYRRIGERGGGWPGTFRDVAAGLEHLGTLARPHGLDLSRLVAVGHSAGGHLALWLAARPRVPIGSPVRFRSAVRPSAAVGLAPIADLDEGARLGICGDAIPDLLGADLAEDRLLAASPARLLPLGVPQTLVSGLLDDIVPAALTREYAEAARRSGDDASLVEIAGAGHFELVDPESAAWPVVRDAIGRALG